MQKKEEKKNKSLLFITRSFPPQIGGMEKLSYNLLTHLKQYLQVYSIINYKGKKNLPLFIIYALIKSPFFVRKVDFIYLSDPTLSIIGFLLKKIFKKPTIFSAHGLDLVFPNKFYQCYLKLFFKPDKLICNSHYTEFLARQKGFNNTVAILLGIDPEDFIVYKKVEIKVISEKFKFPIKNKKIIITVSRLVERKGVAWFVENVMPILSDNIIYLVIGDGQQKQKIIDIINFKKLSNKVFLLGKVDQNLLNSIYSQSHLFIMPNIHIDGDAEGFGYVALEAACWGLPVIASNTDGISDAVSEGENGFLVRSGNALAFRDKITELLSNEQHRVDFGKKARDYTFLNYNWNKIIQIYFREIMNT